MGMYAHYWRITPQEWRNIAEDTKAADAFFGYDLDEEDDDGWDAFFELRRSGQRYLDIQKAWHTLHFLLTDNNDFDVSHVPPPWSYVVLGGTEPQWEEDYGDVRYLTPAQVRETSQAMRNVSREDLRPRLDIERFDAAALYPDAEWDQAGLEAMLDIYDKVAEFFHAASEAGDMILIQIS